MRKSKKKEYRESGKCLFNGIAVSYRICDHNYKCKTCEFHQMIMDYSSELKGGETKSSRPIGLKPKERLCIYSGSEVSFRICDHAYNCSTCEFNQLVQDQIKAREEWTPFYKAGEQKVS